MKSESILRVLVGACGSLVALTGAAKMITFVGPEKVLARPDPIIGITYSSLFLIVGLTEIGIGIYCLMPRRSHYLAIRLLVWLCVNFSLYRYALWWIDAKAPCGCFGTLTERLHIESDTAAIALDSIFAVLIVGVCVAFFLETAVRRKASAALLSEAGCS